MREIETGRRKQGRKGRRLREKHRGWDTGDGGRRNEGGRKAEGGREKMRREKQR